MACAVALVLVGVAPLVSTAYAGTIPGYGYDSAATATTPSTNPSLATASTQACARPTAVAAVGLHPGFLATEEGGDAVYRYVSDGEAQAAQNAGSIPNTDVAGNLRSVFYSTDRYESASEAEGALQIGTENPAGATASPTWRLAASSAGADWSYGGNVDGGSGVEPLAENALRLLGVERLGP